jgi:hypothetical protein
MKFGPPDFNKMKAKWTLTEFDFPATVTYFNDGRMLWASGNFEPRKPPYNTEFTNSYYEVTSFTNAGGVSVPAASTFLVFMTRADATTSRDLRLLFEYHISLSAVKPAEENGGASFQPEFPGRTSVEYPGEIRYIATNRWISHEEAAEMNRAQERQHNRRVSLWRLCIFGSMVILLIPVLAGFFRERSSPTTNNKPAK